MVNKYPAKCHKCKKKVKAGQGICKINQGIWEVEHPKCAAKTLRVHIIQSLPSHKPVEKTNTLFEA